jgi:hypothetical protein
MAFNEILVGRLNRYAQKLLVIKNTALHGFLPELRLVLPIFSGVEDRYLQGWNRFGTESVTAAVAAVNSGNQLRNPAGSGIIVVIEKLYVSPGLSGSAVVVSQAVNNTDLPSAGTGFRLDSRGNSNSTAIFSQSTAAGTTSLANVIMRNNNLANTGYDFIIGDGMQLMLLPGDTIRLVNSNVNDSILTTIMWRERVLESSELT